MEYVMIARILAATLGLASTFANFGCDTSTPDSVVAVANANDGSEVSTEKTRADSRQSQCELRLELPATIKNSNVPNLKWSGIPLGKHDAGAMHRLKRSSPIALVSNEVQLEVTE